jgi:uncharacterized membrane protein YdjX (TVP38/TMEM64 family)
VLSRSLLLGATARVPRSRFVLRDWVQRASARSSRHRPRRGEGGRVLPLHAALVPAVPFFVINLAMGLTPMRVRTFYWVSQLGMLAGHVVYVNAGTQLAAIARCAASSRRA